jgi:hypothetical protein
MANPFTVTRLELTRVKARIRHCARSRKLMYRAKCNNHQAATLTRRSLLLPGRLEHVQEVVARRLAHHARITCGPEGSAVGELVRHDLIRLLRCGEEGDRRWGVRPLNKGAASGAGSRTLPV